MFGADHFSIESLEYGENGKNIFQKKVFSFLKIKTQDGLDLALFC